MWRALAAHPGWVVYAIAVVTLAVVAWRRIGAHDRANAEIERRRQEQLENLRHP